MYMPFSLVNVEYRTHYPKFVHVKWGSVSYGIVQYLHHPCKVYLVLAQQNIFTIQIWGFGMFTYFC